MKTISELRETYQDKKVLITGHTGFKGSWLSIFLKYLGANIVGVSLDCKSSKGAYKSCEMNKKLIADERIDICDKKAIKELIFETKPHFIFHLAAQALVSLSYINPAKTIETNAIGTLNILEAIKDLKHDITVILITSDKCYENIETFYGYKETDNLGGKDPYSASKACAEIIANSYMRSILNNSEYIKIATARAGNVIGGGDWSKDRLIPDAINHWQNNKTLTLRNPLATRPWQHVLEPILGYLELGIFISQNELKPQELGDNSFNFGPKQIDNLNVESVIKILSSFWENSKYRISHDKKFHEASLLNLSCDKSTKLLSWEPRLRIKDALLITSNWYKEQKKLDNMYDFTIQQIESFLNL